MIAELARRTLACLVLSLAVSAQGFEPRKEEAAAALLEQLEQVVSLSVTSKAYRQRDATYRAILVIDPDHAEARRFLKYRFDRKKKVWVQKRYREPRAAAEELELELATLREGELRRYADQVFELVQEEAQALGRERAARELDELLELDPVHPGIRAHRGEVRLELDGKVSWVARETVRARERRPRMKERFKELLQEKDVRPAESYEDEEDLGIEWRFRPTTGVVTGLATTGRTDVESAVRVLHAAWDWMPDFLGGAEVELYTLRVYLLEEQERDRLIDGYPGLSDSFREVLRKVQCARLADENHYACWAPGMEVRLDGLLRQVIALYFRQGYALDGRQGWISQGLGLYLTQRLVGTRRSFMITRDERSSSGQPDLEKRIGDPQADYFALAASSLTERTSSQLAISLGKSANSMTSEDIVATYAMSAWLVESQPARTLQRIFAGCGRGGAPVEVLEECLGLGLPELREKLLRWLGENTEKDW